MDGQGHGPKIDEKHAPLIRKQIGRQVKPSPEGRLHVPKQQCPGELPRRAAVEITCDIRTNGQTMSSSTPVTSTFEAVPVLDAHRFDEAALSAYMERHVEGYTPPLGVQQFQGGS